MLFNDDRFICPLCKQQIFRIYGEPWENLVYSHVGPIIYMWEQARGEYHLSHPIHFAGDINLFHPLDISELTVAFRNGTLEKVQTVCMLGRYTPHQGEAIRRETLERICMEQLL